MSSRARAPSSLLLLLIIVNLTSDCANNSNFVFAVFFFADVMSTADTFTDDGVSSYSQLLFDIARKQVVVGARYVYIVNSYMYIILPPALYIEILRTKRLKNIWTLRKRHLPSPIIRFSLFVND